jgi:hypothetical protein
MAEFYRAAWLGDNRDWFGVCGVVLSIGLAAVKQFFDSPSRRDCLCVLPSRLAAEPLLRRRPSRVLRALFATYAFNGSTRQSSRVARPQFGETRVPAAYVRGQPFASKGAESAGTLCVRHVILRRPLIRRTAGGCQPVCYYPSWRASVPSCRRHALLNRTPAVFLRPRRTPWRLSTTFATPHLGGTALPCPARPPLLAPGSAALSCAGR